MIDSTFVEALADLAKKAATPQEVDVAGAKHYVIGGHLVNASQLARPDIRALELHGLSTFVAYLESDNLEADAEAIDGIKEGTPTLIVVDAPTSVHLFGDVQSPHGIPSRVRYASARFSVAPFPWEKPLTPETAIILLQTRFSPTDDREKLLILLSNLTTTDTTVTVSQDDGMSQRVTTRKDAGQIAVESTTVKNPWILAPKRAFTEVEPPTSPFICRFIPHPGRLPDVTLFETDGGAWEELARERISAYLRKELADADTFTILA